MKNEPSTTGRLMMSVDDQLFKQDGTILTRIDILILKASRVFATLFAGKEDETFLPARAVILKICGYCFLIGAILFAAIGNVFDSSISVILLLLLTLAYTKIPPQHQGKGTNIPHGTKAFNLFEIIFVPYLFSIDLFSWQGVNTLMLATVVRGVGLILYFLSRYYIPRLGGKPPKKKKVEAPKLVFSPSR